MPGWRGRRDRDEAIGSPLRAGGGGGFHDRLLAPARVDGQKIVKILRESTGLTIAGGQDQARGKIFRLAHLGS